MRIRAFQAVYDYLNDNVPINSAISPASILANLTTNKDELFKSSTAFIEKLVALVRAKFANNNYRLGGSAENVRDKAYIFIMNSLDKISSSLAISLAIYNGA